jgi:hypothetical protein
MHKTRETLKEERKSRASVINLYYAFFVRSYRLGDFGNEVNKRAVSERFLTAIKIGNLFIFHFISRSLLFVLPFSPLIFVYFMLQHEFSE